MQGIAYVNPMPDYFEKAQPIVDYFQADFGMHLHKMQEEIGEVAEAWIAANGIGKKAGKFSMDDVFEEVCDVIVSSITAARKLDKNAGERFKAKWQAVEHKLGIRKPE
jgi:NTP pyrophosphatase (non-canonical NTP hydrolase)